MTTSVQRVGHTLAGRPRLSDQEEQRPSDFADDPVWRSVLDAPPGPPETEEQRRWSEEAEIEERAVLPEGVQRAMRNARPGRPDTDEEKQLFARRRLEPDVPSSVVTAEIEHLREGGR